MANTLFNVQGYAQDYALPILENQLTVAGTLNPEYRNWKQSVQMRTGTLNDTFVVDLPIRRNVRAGLTFNTTTSGDFQQRQLAVVADQQSITNFQYTNLESALFRSEDIISNASRGSINEMGNTFEIYYVDQVGATGYRFFGSPFPTQNPNQLQDVSSITEAVKRFESFGACRAATKYVVMPNIASTRTTQSSFQQFVPDRNEKIAVDGDIGRLNGAPTTSFRESNLLGIHVAGTMSNDEINTTTGYTIASVVPDSATPNDGNNTNTSTITLSGVPDGLTFNTNDMIDIGQNNTIVNPIYFLTFTGYRISEAPVQGRVVAPAVAAGGTITFQVNPAYIFDNSADPSVSRNLSRAIIPGDDTVRVVQSHRVGLIYYGELGFRVNPRLPETDPFKSGIAENKETGITFRSYYGHVFGDGTQQFVYDAIYGYGAAREGFGRLIYPI